MHKFLGVLIDQELCFKENINYTLQKGSKFYLAVAVPRMLYAADLFLVPSTHQSKVTKGYINKHARIQRQAALPITGAIKTTATDTLDATPSYSLSHSLCPKL